MRNADASPASYRFDSREQIRIWNEIEGRGMELVAIYHSHTRSEAYPSETDRRQAFEPNSIYLLVSLADGDNPVMRAFRIAEREITEEELKIE